MFGMFFVAVGCVCFGLLMAYQGPLVIGMTLLTFGMAFIGVGLIEITLTVRGLDSLEEDIKITVVPAFIVKEYVKVREKLSRDFRRDRKAIGWQLAVFFAAIPACIFAWFVAAWPTDVVWTSVSGLVTFTGPEAAAVNLVRQIISLLVGVAVFTSIIWLWVNAHRTEVSYA